MRHTMMTCAIALAAAGQASWASAEDGAAGGALLARTPADEALAAGQGRLDTITVVATRSPSKAFDFPGEVTVLERDRILDFNPSDIGDLFVAVPGAQFTGGPRRNGEAPVLRGLSGGGVQVFFDGARQSFLSGHDGRFFIDPELVKTLEVLRGPSSALYGSGALGGVVALRTIDAAGVLADDETAAIRLGSGFHGVNNEWRGSFSGVWRSADDRLDAVGHITYRQSGDIALGNGLGLQADDEIASSLAKIGFRPNEALALRASWMRYGGNSLDPNNPQGLNAPGPGNDLVNRDIDSNTLQAGLRYAPPDQPLIDLDAVFYYSRNTVSEAETSSPRVASRQVETFGFSADNRSSFTLTDRTALTLTYGGEFYTDDQIGRDSASADGNRGGVPNAKTRFYGAFAQAELNWQQPLGAPGELRFIPGIRWDRYESRAAGEPDLNDSAASPKLALAYEPVPALMVFGNWSKGFRAPSFNEIFADDLHFRIPNLGAFPPFPPQFVSNFFITNTDLVAEKSRNWEAGAGVDFDAIFADDDRFTAKASYYRAKIDNLIDLEVAIPAGCFGAPFPPCGSGAAFGNFSRFVNVADAVLDGIELEASYSARYVYAHANFATIAGRNTATDAYVGSLSPDHLFVDGGVKLADGAMRLGTRLSVVGNFTKVNDPTLARDSFTTADIYAVWQPRDGMLEGLRVDLGIDNVTDSAGEIVAAGVSQPGRNVKLALSWRQGF